MSSDVGSGTKRRPDTPKWDRKWPHDQPAGWNLDAARLLMLVQSAGGMMWLGLGRAKYLELRVDTRDGAFNLYDRDGQPLNPDDVVEAVEKAISNYGPFDAPASSPAGSSDSLDARRYRRLRVLGAAPGESKQLSASTVLRFTGLDEHIDNDLRTNPSRGETTALPATEQQP